MIHEVLHLKLTFTSISKKKKEIEWEGEEEEGGREREKIMEGEKGPWWCYLQGLRSFCLSSLYKNNKRKIIPFFSKIFKTFNLLKYGFAIYYNDDIDSWMLPVFLPTVLVFLSISI